MCRKVNRRRWNPSTILCFILFTNLWLPIASIQSQQSKLRHRHDLKTMIRTRGLGKDPDGNDMVDPNPVPTPNPTTLTPTTLEPTASPTSKPTLAPTDSPTKSPTDTPTENPTTLAPTPPPTGNPTLAPTENPTIAPTTGGPTQDPTTLEPTLDPTNLPTQNPTTGLPTDSPTIRVDPPGKSDGPTDMPTTEPKGLDPECTRKECGSYTLCNRGGSCYYKGVCASTYDGGGLCVKGDTSCGLLLRCSNSGTCKGEGEICLADTCCGHPVCVPTLSMCSNPTSPHLLSRSFTLFGFEESHTTSLRGECEGTLGGCA